MRQLVLNVETAETMNEREEFCFLYWTEVANMPIRLRVAVTVRARRQESLEPVPKIRFVPGASRCDRRRSKTGAGVHLAQCQPREHQVMNNFPGVRCKTMSL